MIITTIAIVEDNKEMANLLKQIIETEKTFSVQGVYGNAIEALLQLPDNPTDLVIMDIQLPDGNGYDVVKKLKPQLTQTLFIMNTSFDEDEKIFESLKAGAIGYILKSDEPDKIIQAIHETLQGGAPMSMSIAKKVIQFFTNQQKLQQKLEMLTEKENELLLLLSKGLLYKEIGLQMSIGLDTVKKHAGNIYKKLHVNNRTEAINIFLNR